MPLIPTRRRCVWGLTLSLFIQLLLSFGSSLGSLLYLLGLTALVEVLNHNSHKHVQYKEGNQQQKWDEINQSPFVEVLLRLRRQTGNMSVTFPLPHLTIYFLSNEVIFSFLLSFYLLMNICSQIESPFPPNKTDKLCKHCTQSKVW